MTNDPPSAERIVDVALRGVGATTLTSRRLRSALFLINKIERILKFDIHSSIFAFPKFLHRTDWKFAASGDARVKLQRNGFNFIFFGQDFPAKLKADFQLD